MPGYLRQSTASQSRALGPFISSTDFVSASTSLSIANTDIKLVVNGGASANKNSGGGTHRVNGVYGVTFDATDTATVGEMEVSVAMSGALIVFDKFFVIEEAVYDELFAASALGYIANAPVSVAQWSGSNVATPSVAGVPEVDLTHIDGTVNASATFNLKKLNVVNSSGDAIVASSTGSNGIGLKCTGNGSGDGIFAGGGATGHGLEGLGGSSSGDGIRGISQPGATVGCGIRAHSYSDDGDGIEAKGELGSGMLIQALSGNFAGLNCLGSGNNPGAKFTGGATGSGITAGAGGGDGDGLQVTGAGAGSGLRGVGGTSGHGAYVSGGATSGDGMRAAAQGDGHGALMASGANGHGVFATGGATTGNGITAQAVSGSGIGAEGLAADGNGIYAYSALSDGFWCGGSQVSGAGSGINALTGGTGKSITAAVETGADLVESLRLANAANAGKLSGAATTNVKIRNLADSLDRVDATVDASGNRTAVTRNVT